MVANVAALRAGLVVVPANAAYTERELAHIVADVSPAAAVVDDPERARWVADASTAPLPVLSVDLDVVAGTAIRGRQPEDGHDLDAGGHGRPGAHRLHLGDDRCPKGAVLSHGNLLANSESVGLTWRWEPDDRLVHALPIFHGHGLCVALYTSLLLGSSLVLLPRFDRRRRPRRRVGPGPRCSSAFPPCTTGWRPRPGWAQLSRLRLAVSGSAPLAADLHGRISAGGGVDVLERYGMTETLMTISNPYEGERRPGTGRFRLPGSRGRCLEDGEILVRGPTIFHGYWKRPAATAATREGRLVPHRRPGRRRRRLRHHPGARQ